jgi:hypothetical protein
VACTLYDVDAPLGQDLRQLVDIVQWDDAIQRTGNQQRRRNNLLGDSQAIEITQDSQVLAEQRHTSLAQQALRSSQHIKVLSWVPNLTHVPHQAAARLRLTITAQTGPQMLSTAETATRSDENQRPTATRCSHRRGKRNCPTQ